MLDNDWCLIKLFVMGVTNVINLVDFVNVLKHTPVFLLWYITQRVVVYCTTCCGIL